MRSGALVAALATVLAAAPAGAQGDELDALRTAYRSGRYEEAIEGLRRHLGDPGDGGAGAARLLVDSLLAVGRYDEAIATARTWREGNPAAPELATRLGLALARTGRREEAEAAFQEAMRGAAADALRARLQLAILEFHGGRREEAQRRFDSFIDVYNARADLDAADLRAVAVACTYLGRDEPALFHDAVRAYEEAIEADPDDLEPRLGLGLLFLDKYDSTEATTLIDQVLAANPRHPEALLAHARRLQFDGEPGALAAARAALEVNPNLVPAHALVGRLELIAERPEAAERAARAALAVDARSLDAFAVLAAARFVAGDAAGFEAAAGAALALGPNDAELFVTTAELAVQNRRYADAVALAQRAVAVDPSSWAAWGTLGINQLRIGDIDPGRESLERAFAGDPFNVWFKNTLDLLDTFEGYRSVATESFDLFVERTRAELLSLYMGPLADEALATLAVRYGYLPPGRVRVEVFSRHADFSVRTVGLAGMGALGVAFGPVVAVDAPATPGMGEYNWGATLWHEIAHVVTLGATDNRIPRWLTEGLSVFEERRARPGWGDDVSPGFLLAHLQGRLLPVSRIADGFVRPAYPEQLAHSYLQASLVCEMIARDRGFEAIREMLDAYRRGQDTAAVFRDVLGVAPEGLDEPFVSYIQETYGPRLRALRAAAEVAPAHGGGGAEGGERPPPVAWTDMLERAREDPGDYVAQLTAGRALVQQGRPDEAREYLERARELFPEHAGPDSAYPMLARLYEEQGRIDDAVGVLEDMTAHNAGHLAAWEQLGALYARQGRPREAAEALQQTVWIDPYRIATHEHLAGLWEEQARWDDAVRERRAALALEPVDRAQTLFRLARAHLGAGDREQARRAVLGALEIAPGYPEAQQLLLQLRSGQENTR